MLSKLLTPNNAGTRTIVVPLAVERGRYLAHMLLEGRSKRQIRTTASMLVHATLFLGIRELVQFDRETIRHQSRKWAYDPDKHQVGTHAEPRARFFFNTVVNWLCFNGMLIAPTQFSTPYGTALEDFLDFLRQRGGMSKTTITTHGLRTRQFLNWVGSRKTSLSLVDLNDVERYLDYVRSKGLKPRSIASSCQSLRTFFRYLATRFHPGFSIASGIRSPAVPRYDPDPRGPRWSEVKRLIAAKSQPSSADVRARAMLLLFAVFGLRSSEVSNLLLTDFDWVEETFLVRRVKNGRVQRMPLAYQVGEAILKYLREVRPPCSSRSLFVTLNPPYRRVPITSMGTIVDIRMKRLNLQSPHRGPHALRHSCATQLLHKGSSLKEIADFLGHRNTSSVCIYAKPSAASVRRVAAFSLDGLI